MKEIGSIFPLTAEQIYKNEEIPVAFPTEKIFYSLCREALGEIARNCKSSNNTVLLPAYTCQTVIDPFQVQGWNTEFYSIHRDLRIDIGDLRRKVALYSPSIIVVHPYFGMDLNEYEDDTLSSIHKSGIIIIVDLTQCLFSKHEYGYADYIVGSYRKWFPIPDGGFLSTNNNGFEQPREPNVQFSRLQADAMYLRGIYFQDREQLLKDISIRINKEADSVANHTIEPHRMSDLAYNLLQQEDFEFNQRQRLSNFKYLYDNIEDGARVLNVCTNFDYITTAPLYFTLYVRKRKELQSILAQNAIYAPVIWPIEEDKVLITDDVKYIYENLLAIPCDQRYDINDMQRISEILKEFNEKD